MWRFAGDGRKSGEVTMFSRIIDLNQKKKKKENSHSSFQMESGSLEAVLNT